MPSPIDPNSWASAASTTVDSFTRLVETFSKHFASSVMTALILLLCYAGYAAIQEGSPAEAFRVLLTSKAERAKQDAEAKAMRMQDELRAVTASNAHVQRAMESLLAGSTGAVRVRFAVIHNGVVTLSGLGVLKWDLIQGAAIKGRAIGEYVTNQPMSSWNDYMSKLVDGQCAYMPTQNLTSDSARFRMQGLGVVGFLACPVVNVQGQMIGAVFLSWDDERLVPADMTQATADLKTAAIRISAAYDLRPRAN